MKKKLPLDTNTIKLAEEIAEQFPLLIDRTQAQPRALFTVHKDEDGVYVTGLPENTDFDKLILDSSTRKTETEKNKDKQLLLADKIRKELKQFTVTELRLMFPHLAGEL